MTFCDVSLTSQNPDEKPPTTSTLEPLTINRFSETMKSCGLMGVLCISLMAFSIHLVKAKAAQHNQAAKLEFVVRNGEELMAKRDYLIPELLAELTKKEGHTSQEIARLAAKAVDEENDKIHGNLLQHEADNQRDQVMGKQVKTAAKLEKAKRDWEFEIGLLMKINGQRAERGKERVRPVREKDWERGRGEET